MTLQAPAKLMPWFLTGSMVLFLLTLAVFIQASHQPWKPYQRAFIHSLREKAETPAEFNAIKNFQMGIRQIEIPALGRIDRCTTCHLAVNHPDFINAPQPIRSHPYAEHHSFEEFGCTVCHRGNGLATSADAAHGLTPDATQPMLPTRFVSASCLACHDLNSLPGQENLKAGRQLFENNGCLSCHALNDTGGRIGPALDNVGLKWDADWLMRHFKDPQSMSPGSAMPPVQLDDQNRELLVLYVLGLVDQIRDPFFLSQQILPTPEAGRDLYYRKGCIGCHGLDDEGGNLGPDLSHLGQRGKISRLRYVLKVTLPNATMPHPDLRPDEREALIAFLLKLNEPDQ
ncbi:c-type cytochrome [Kiritimatiellota bacterium B12222]|nr:c-type cytochrome [Kiritimatiellota bacterium B12222]